MFQPVGLSTLSLSNNSGHYKTLLEGADTIAISSYNCLSSLLRQCMRSYRSKRGSQLSQDSPARQAFQELRLLIVNTAFLDHHQFHGKLYDPVVGGVEDTGMVPVVLTSSSPPRWLHEVPDTSQVTPNECLVLWLM